MGTVGHLTEHMVNAKSLKADRIIAKALIKFIEKECGLLRLSEIKQRLRKENGEKRRHKAFYFSQPLKPPLNFTRAEMNFQTRSKPPFYPLPFHSLEE